MFKILFMMKRRAGISLDEFIGYYENRHLPFLGAAFPPSEQGAKTIRRNYIRRDDPFLKTVEDGRADANPPIDCVTEVEFDRREDAEAAMRMLFDPANLERIKEDERNFVDMASIRYYVAEVHERVMGS